MTRERTLQEIDEIRAAKKQGFYAGYIAARLAIRANTIDQAWEDAPIRKEHDTLLASLLVQPEQEQQKNEHGAALLPGDALASPATTEALPNRDEARREQYMPARLAFCRALMKKCRNVASERGCFSDRDGICVQDSEMSQWCNECLIGEASVQIEWLLGRVGSGTDSSQRSELLNGQERSAKDASEAL